MSTLVERYREHLFFTWSPQSRSQGLEIVDARGARFEVAGKGWVWDLESQVYNVTVGHKHPHVQRRMIEQIERLPACAPNAILPIRAELGEHLTRLTGLSKVFLGTGGSEAVENAIKMARLVTGRRKVVARRHSYHGASLCVLAIAGDPRGDAFAGDMPAPLHIEDPYPARAPTRERPSDWLESFSQLVEREGGETIAAVLLEGLTGTNGMQEPPTDFWPGVRSLCDAHGILLIDDEIFSGFGRTGKWFAREHWGVRADLMTIGKGVTSGYAPLSGVLASEAVARHFEDETLWCGLTHYAHPVSCAAAVGTIEVMEREGLVAQAAAMGRRVRERLSQLAEDPALAGHVRSLRGRGLMQGIEFDRDVAPLIAQLWVRNLFVPGRGTMLFLCPPLCVTAAEIDEIMDELEAAIREWLA